MKSKYAMEDEFFICQCFSDEHTLRFSYIDNSEFPDFPDGEDSFYTSVFLNKYQSIWKRIWIALKYIFGYKCKYGHWDCFDFKMEDRERLIEFLSKDMEVKK
ncbi:MAG: hypothetical protein ABIC57_02940 [bacterium]